MFCEIESRMILMDTNDLKIRLAFVLNFFSNIQRQFKFVITKYFYALFEQNFLSNHSDRKKKTMIIIE